MEVQLIQLKSALRHLFEECRYENWRQKIIYLKPKDFKSRQNIVCQTFLILNFEILNQFLKTIDKIGQHKPQLNLN